MRRSNPRLLTLAISTITVAAFVVLVALDNLVAAVFLLLIAALVLSYRAHRHARRPLPGRQHTDRPEQRPGPGFGNRAGSP